MRLEAQKFAVYLLIPITASLAFNEPTVQKAAADYFQFMKYPSNPKTNLKDEFESLKKQREEEIEWEKRMTEKREKGREEHMRQLKMVRELNARGGGVSDGGFGSESSPRRGWFGWIKAWKRGENGAVPNGKSDSDR